MHVEHDSNLDAAGLRVGIALSRYHREITESLCAGAIETFTGAGGERSDLVVVHAPGGFELPAICRALAHRPDIDCVIALGCILRGETSHDQHIADAVAHGLMQIATDTGKPVGFGVLTCQTLHQAKARAGGAKGNKGEEAMAAVIEAVHALREIAAAPARDRKAMTP